MYDMKYLNDFYVSEINWAETFLFEKYESAHLATAALGCFKKKEFSLFQFWPSLLWTILKNIHTHKKSAQNVEK